MPRKRKTSEPPKVEGAPAWMNTYGDMVTLILTFFILLFSFSTVNAKKWEGLVKSFHGENFVAVAASEASAAGATGTGSEVSAGNGQSQTNHQDSPAENANDTVPKEVFNELYEKLKNHIQQNGLENELNVEKTGEVITLRITDSALFDSGRDQIRYDAIAMLDNLTDMFKTYENVIGMIRIEGHTDNVPISTSKFQSNWDLSVSRAVNVLQYLLRNSKITPNKFSAVGYGEFRPVASNDTEEGKALNRRVDFVIESITKIE